MKNTLFLAAFLLLAVACKKTPVNPTTSTILPDGPWKITLYLDRTDDKTSNYANWSFDFKTDGTITATGSSSTHSGTWATGTDDSTDKLVLTFSNSSSSSLSELNEDWHVIEKTADFIHLEHISGGDGHLSVLHFTKI